MRAIRIDEFGGPEVMRLVQVDDPVPVDGTSLVQVTAAGVNYADTHQSEDTYLAKQRLPLVPGGEVAGRLPDGTRVVALLAGSGGYAEQALAPVSTTFPVPDDITDGQALALVLQGLTAYHLLVTCAHLAPGESVLVHAAAGGVGSLAVQLAKVWGAGRVIGTASTEDKRDLVLDLGADAAVAPDAEMLVEAVREANGGRPVDIVLEMTGGPVFDASLHLVAPFGRLVTFGQASRQPATPVDPVALMARSRAVVGFWLAHCMSRPGMLRQPLHEMFEMVQEERIRPLVGATYPLSEAARAHRDMRARRTVGKVVLDPAG